MEKSLKILSSDLLEEYLPDFPLSAKEDFERLNDSELNISAFDFYTSVSAVFSSKIEGEDIELDSFIKYKRLGIEYQPDYTRKIDDLYNAYCFARKNRLNPESILIAHAELTKHILSKGQQGRFRNGNMFVMTDDGKIEYVAATPNKIVAEMEKLYDDINSLTDSSLSLAETFFYASMLHLVFVKIHPFNDGNGRTARLIEKWFLAEKLGEKAWFLQSERYYYDNHSSYYGNIRNLGLEYDELSYSKALPFLKMLCRTINYTKQSEAEV
jgi:Fic family protein